MQSKIDSTGCVVQLLYNSFINTLYFLQYTLQSYHHPATDRLLALGLFLWRHGVRFFCLVTTSFLILTVNFVKVLFECLWVVLLALLGQFTGLDLLDRKFLYPSKIWVDSLGRVHHTETNYVYYVFDSEVLHRLQTLDIKLVSLISGLEYSEFNEGDLLNYQNELSYLILQVNFSIRSYDRDHYLEPSCRTLEGHLERLKCIHKLKSALA